MLSMAFVNLGNFVSISSSIRRKRMTKTRSITRTAIMKTSRRRNMEGGRGRKEKNREKKKTEPQGEAKRRGRETKKKDKNKTRKRSCATRKTKKGKQRG
jgi:hypothetical protein